jgi:hypothetical protein
MIAKIVRVHLADNEWGNPLMRQVAQEMFGMFPEADVVVVYEHAGWALSYLRDGTIVGTANADAVLSDEAKRFRAGVRDTEQIAEIRRSCAAQEPLLA